MRSLVAVEVVVFAVAAILLARDGARVPTSPRTFTLGRKKKASLI
jgi:hypothetical protein